MKHFYVRKLETLGIMQDRINELRKCIEDLATAEQGVSVGTIDEMGEMSDALEALEDLVVGLAMAVEPLAEASAKP